MLYWTDWFRGVKALFKAAAQPGLRAGRSPTSRAAGVAPARSRSAVLRTGICGTDLHIRVVDALVAGAVQRAPLIARPRVRAARSSRSAPCVRDVGRRADRVSGEGHVVCGTCRNCRAGRRHLCIRTVDGSGVNRDGAFAEYVALPESNVWVHRDAIDLDPDSSDLRSVRQCRPHRAVVPGGR